jgi:DNA-binding winged helix-turn-helix (wHTH) protein/Tfp pilus assembly protein PilF
MPEQVPVVYEFGGFRLEVNRRLLLGPGDAVIALTPKALDTLLHLIENRSAVVTKDSLIKAVWPDTVVEENNLNQNISALRRALGGSRNENRYIVTVPGRGYSFVATVTTTDSPLHSGAQPALRSLAVLPFRPLVIENSDASLELGMADTLIARLSTIRELVVRPTSAVRGFTQPDLDPLVAGRQLGVETVLEGSLQRYASKVRVTARLLSISTGKALWAGTFDEPFTDIFALQDAISEKVVKALELQLSSADKKQLTKHHTASTEAYQLYLKGRFYWWKTDPEEFKKSREYFHKAVEADPSYALGYCGLNSFYGFGSAWGVLPPEVGWPKAEWAVRKALELDDNLAEAHLGLAAFKMIQLDWAGAERESKRAIEINPQFDEIHYFYSFLLVVLGRFEEAVASARRALSCDPFSLRISLHLANTFYQSRRFDEAVRQYRQVLDTNADDASTHEALGDVLEQMGNQAAAVAEWLRAATLAGDSELISTIKNANGFSEVVRGIARTRLRRLAAEVEKGTYVPSAHFVRANVRLGDNEQALRFLEKAADEQNVHSLVIVRDPQYDPLKEFPEYSKLLDRLLLLNLPKA